MRGLFEQLDDAPLELQPFISALILPWSTLLGARLNVLR